MFHRCLSCRWDARRSIAWLCPSLLVSGVLLSLLLSGLVALATDDVQLDTDEILKPLVDTTAPESKPAPSESGAGQDSLHQPAVLQGKAEKKGDVPVNLAPSRKPLVLTGKVQTLQEAIVSEQSTVDWYAWYLACREYLSRTGGLQCALGTPIKFYRNGRIEAMTFDPLCLESVAGRHFALPKKTALDALILPVRQGAAPPASPQEIYSRIHSLQSK